MLLIPTTICVSDLHGIGLFAAERVPRGTLVWRFEPGFDQKFSDDVVARLSPAAREQLLNYAYRSKQSPVYVLCTDDARFFNHSETPNVMDDAMEEGMVIAGRDIEPGEELTCDYRTFDADFERKFGRAVAGGI